MLFVFRGEERRNSSTFLIQYQRPASKTLVLLFDEIHDAGATRGNASASVSASESMFSSFSFSSAASAFRRRSTILLMSLSRSRSVMTVLSVFSCLPAQTLQTLSTLTDCKGCDHMVSHSSRRGSTRKDFWMSQARTSLAQPKWPHRKTTRLWKHIFVEGFLGR